MLRYIAYVAESRNRRTIPSIFCTVRQETVQWLACRSQKDIVHMKGVPTSCCSRAYSELYPACKTTSSSIAKLVSLGAQIVGKPHLSALALKEEPAECVDYSAPFNPRGDGYQVSQLSSDETKY